MFPARPVTRITSNSQYFGTRLGHIPTALRHVHRRECPRRRGYLPTRKIGTLSGSCVMGNPTTCRASVLPPGSPPAVNAVWRHRVAGRGGKQHVQTYKSAAVAPWFEVSAMALLGSPLRRNVRDYAQTHPDFLLRIVVTWVRSNRRRRDADNILKVLGDVIQSVTGIDDSRYEWTTHRRYDKPEGLEVAIHAISE